MVRLERGSVGRLGLLALDEGVSEAVEGELGLHGRDGQVASLLDLGDDEMRAVRLEGGGQRSLQLLQVVDRGGVCDSAGLGGRLQAGAGAGVAQLVAGLPPCLVVVHQDDQIPRPFPSDRGEGAQVHEQGAVAIQADDLLVGGQGHAQADGRNQPHVAVGVEVPVPVSGVPQFVGGGAQVAHDGPVIGEPEHQLNSIEPTQTYLRAASE